MTTVTQNRLLDHYQRRIDAGGFEADPSQTAVVERLQDLQQRLLQEPASGGNWIQRLRRRPPPPQRGLYIWGSVGRGKTWLVDLFYSHLPLAQKQRIHFHHFMRQTHDELARLKQQKNPLEKVAAQLAKRIRLLCLDEFIVSDIADAMILSQLLHGLFRHGVTLVTTSNTRPDQLYLDGIQRASFLPAIDLLQRHLEVIELGGMTDYRLRLLEQASTYHTPLDDAAALHLTREFERLATDQQRQDGKLRVFHRDIPVKQLTEGIAWFDFMALCGPPRAQADYLEIARSFHTVIISDIPRLGPALDDVARRFLYLLDEFYDRNVKLIISAAEPPEQLYQGERLAFDFRRASSRLREMQSTQYLAREHRP